MNMANDQGNSIKTGSVTRMASYSFKDGDMKKLKNTSLLVVLEPLTPFLYRSAGEVGESVKTERFYEGRSVASIPSEWRSQVDSNGAFLQEFTYIEFYINQILKLLISNNFSTEEWRRLEEVVDGSYISFENKQTLIKKFDRRLWDTVKVNLKHLQKLRNSLAHNPIGPFIYNNAVVDWSVVDEDLEMTRLDLLNAYKDKQGPIMDYLSSIEHTLDI
jgi:hypothetical protein